MDNTQARALLKAKLALEDEIRHPLHVILRQYIDAIVAAKGALTPLERDEHRHRVENLLLRHYARVVMVVTGRKPIYSPSISDAAFSLAHAQSLVSRARQQSKLLLGTIDRGMQRGIAMISAGHVEDGTDQHSTKHGDTALDTKQDTGTNTPTPPEPNIVVGYILDLVNIAKMVAKQLGTRMGGIANAQTNGPAEEARQIQAQEQAAAAANVEVVPDADATHDVIQIWHNVGDNRVRGAPNNPRYSAYDHWTCEGQERSVDQPFLISGEMLRFPGDSALGATIGNLVNCRCFIETVLVNKLTGERTSIHTAASEPASRTRRRTDSVPDGDIQPHRLPTTNLRLNGNSRGKAVLANHQIVSWRQETPGTLVFSIGKETIARASISKDGVGSIQVSPNHGGKGIEELIRRVTEYNQPRLP